MPREGNGYPDGLGAEVIDFDCINCLNEKVKTPYHREHVTSYIWDNHEDFLIGTVKAPPDIQAPDIILDLDTNEDYERLQEIVRLAPVDPVDWTAAEIIAACRSTDYF
jgi:spore coat polysaccharide biosynthesis protein SpsF